MNVDAIFSALGRFSVRFRWTMLLAWIVGAVAASSLLPGLSSITQSDNTKFLPASAPVEKATMLAKPFGTSNLLPVPLVAARQSGPLTAADTAALTALQARLKSDPRSSASSTWASRCPGRAARRARPASSSCWCISSAVTRTPGPT